MRKSVSLGKGARLSVSKTGIGASVGGKGMRYSAHSSGRRTKSIGIPGSGVGYVKTSGGGSTRTSRQSAAPPPPATIPKPGMLAPAHEKAFAKGVTLYASGDVEQALWHFQDAAHKDDQGKSIADDFFAGILCVQLRKGSEATNYLERVVRSDTELPDALMSKYVPGGGIEISVTPQVSMSVPFGSTAATLALTEVYQQAGRGDEAIGLLMQLLEVERQTPLVLSLAELLAEAGSWDEVVQLTAGTKNDDDATLAICVYQAQALAEKGMTDAALEVYKDALRSKKRNDELLKRARYGRGRLLLSTGKKAQGRKDLGRVYADDPGYRDVAQLLNDEE